MYNGADYLLVYCYEKSCIVRGILFYKNYKTSQQFVEENPNVCKWVHITSCISLWIKEKILHIQGFKKW